MKKSYPHWQRSAVSSAVALAIASIQTPVWAACPGTVSGTETTACTLTAVESVSITTGNALDVAGATAITVDGAAAGVTVTNSGTIEANTVSIYLQLGNTGTTIDNQLGGIIRANSGLAVTGLFVNGAFDGSLTNAGTIQADAGTATLAVFGYGIQGSGALTGSLTNSGTINVSGISTANAALMNGILLGSVSGTGTLINSSAITVAATGANQADAYGIQTGAIAGSLTNSGNLGITATSQTAGSAVARGIQVANVTGSLENASSGSITATANGNNAASAYAYGIRFNGIALGGSITNNGTITANALADTASWASVYGVLTNATISGSLTNAGTITATASGTSNSGAGIFISTIGATGSLTNTNTGVISATANGANYAEMRGIGVGTLNSGGTLTNAGTITSTANALVAGDELAYGLVINTLNGTVTNSGTVTATSTNGGNIYALYAGTGAGTANNNGGTLNGSVSLNGTVNLNNSGTINLPRGVLSTNTIGGDYTQTGSGRLGFEAMSAADYAAITIAGTADFSAGNNLHVNVNNANTLAVGDQLLNVISAGTLTATSFNVTDNFALFNFSATIDGNTVDLTTLPGLTILQASALGGASPAALGVAGALDSINAGTPSSDMTTVLGTLNGMTEAEIAAATEQLMPALSGAVGHLTNQISGVMPDAMDERLNGQRGLSSGDMMSDRKAWVKPFGNWAEQNDRKGVYGYDADSYGIALGADADTGAGWRLGAAFAYANSDVDSNNSNLNHQIDIASYQIGVYASRQIDADTTLDIKAAWGMSSYDSDRRINFLTPVRAATADYDSWHLRLNAKLSHQISLNANTSVAPHVRADYAYVDVDSYRESGAGALNLNVNGDTEDTFILGVGADLDHATSDKLTLKANLGVGYDISADQSSLDAAFVNDGAVFSTQGLDPDPLVLRAGAGVVFANVKDMEISGRYDVEARQNYTNQGVSMNLRWKF